jgi:hypothetical protein
MARPSAGHGEGQMSSIDERDYQAAVRTVVATVGPEGVRDLLTLLGYDDAIRAEGLPPVS